MVHGRFMQAMTRKTINNNRRSSNRPYNFCTHPNSPWDIAKLILNNILFPAKKKERKT
ncbi:MAG: hypothetical protein U0T81_00385 [Saprospiraceae bacterium]